jgi:CRP-like cAMP-binding protein
MAELNIVEKVIALEGVDLLKNLSPDQLSRIASIAGEVHFQPGATILDPSKPLDSLYVILDGTVELSSREGAVTRAGQNDVLGAWALFDPDPLPVTAKAIDDVKLLRIGRDDFYDLLSDNMEITASIFTILVRRFRQVLEGGSAK